jgi:HAMP domain-containing protein
MTPEQMTELMQHIDRVGVLTTAVLIVEVLIAIALAYAHVRITRNQVALSDLVQQAAAKIESHLQSKK